MKPTPWLHHSWGPGGHRAFSIQAALTLQTIKIIIRTNSERLKRVIKISVVRCSILMLPKQKNLFFFNKGKVPVGKLYNRRLEPDPLPFVG